MVEKNNESQKPDLITIVGKKEQISKNPKIRPYIPQNYRCDLLWRNLVRLFRRWLKSEAIQGQHKECLETIRKQDYER